MSLKANLPALALVGAGIGAFAFALQGAGPAGQPEIALSRSQDARFIEVNQRVPEVDKPNLGTWIMIKIGLLTPAPVPEPPRSNFQELKRRQRVLAGVRAGEVPDTAEDWAVVYEHTDRAARDPAFRAALRPATRN